MQEVLGVHAHNFSKMLELSVVAEADGVGALVPVFFQLQRSEKTDNGKKRGHMLNVMAAEAHVSHGLR